MVQKQHTYSHIRLETFNGSIDERKIAFKLEGNMGKLTSKLVNNKLYQKHNTSTN